MYIPRAFHPIYTVQLPHPTIILTQSSRDSPVPPPSLLLLLLHLQVRTIQPTREFRVNLHYVCVGTFIYIYSARMVLFYSDRLNGLPPSSFATPQSQPERTSGRGTYSLSPLVAPATPRARTSVTSHPDPTTAALLYNNYYNNITLHTYILYINMTMLSSTSPCVTYHVYPPT